METKDICLDEMVNIISSVTKMNKEDIYVNGSKSYDIFVVHINLKERVSVYFLKKITERLLGVIERVFNYTIIEYVYEGEILYSYTRTRDKENEGYTFK